MPKRKRTTPPLTINGSLVTNAAQTQVANWFAQATQTNPKHNYNFDFGYPDSITFEMKHAMYRRNGIARAGVSHAINKTWSDYPMLTDGEEAHKETKIEAAIRVAFKRLAFWQKLREADERSRVGDYAGLIFRFADDKLFSEPVDTVPGGLDGLVEIIPCFEGQLTVSEYDSNERSPKYGKPKSFLFNEASVDRKRANNRSFQLHPSRVVVWSRDGTVCGDSVLEAGYNDLLTMEKIIGSGGEGFWKNAKSSPVLSMDKDMNPASLATMLGVEVTAIADKLDEVIAGWQKGFDQLLMLQGIDAKTLGVTLPQPAEFFAVALQSFAASINEPLKILIGSQSGERASTEDAKEWNGTIMSRRENYVKPNIERVLDLLRSVKVLPDIDWAIGWTDLTEDTKEERVANAGKLAEINKSLMGTGEVAFTAGEIREAAGYMEPLADSDLLPEDEDADAE